jgi:hypothetical protein
MITTLQKNILARVVRVIPVNHRGNPDADGGLAGACWKQWYSAKTNYIVACESGCGYRVGHDYGILKYDNGNYWFFIDTMRGIDGIDQGLGALAHECEYFKNSSEPYAIIIPRIGSGIAGYDFDTQIKPLIDKHLGQYEITICDQNSGVRTG